MDHLGAIEGEAELFMKGTSLGNVRYKIDVWQQRPQGLKSAAGELFADAYILDKAFSAGELLLVLEDGNKIAITVKRYYGGEDRAEILVSGPVPGF